jgi:aspartyl/asparaginyl beta-hydroxylase (cupin superfamily)
VARLHFPLVTNERVIFSTWNEFDKEENYHYGFGEVWVIDTRKPHKAVNGGKDNRIHLVVDVVVTPKIERIICEGTSRRIE